MMLIDKEVFEGMGVKIEGKVGIQPTIELQIKTFFSN